MGTIKLLLPYLLSLMTILNIVVFFMLLTSLPSCKNDDNNSSYPSEYYNTEWGSANKWDYYNQWHPIEDSLILWDNKVPEYLRINWYW